MQLIPSLVLQHLADPAKIETLFINYIKKAGLTIDASKTIAGVAYYHKKNFPLGAKSATFFNGAYDSTATNMPGNSFIRPASEHILIWATRWEAAVGDKITDLIWTPGVQINGFTNNLQMTITTNSEVKVKKFPLSEGLSDLTVRTNGLIPLAEPIFWGGQQDFIVLVEDGEDIGAQVASTNLKCTLIGLGLI